jgi:hypothetical protein
MGPEKLLEVPPMMHSFTRSKGVAWPLYADLLRKLFMLSHLVCVAMLAFSFQEILCYFLPGNIILPVSLMQIVEIATAISL